MAIKRLEVEGVRCLAPTSWNLDPGVNVVVGENGAGKTSLLEAISLVCTGKTLRTGSSRGAIAHGQERLRVAATFGEGLEAGDLVYERTRAQRLWRLNDAVLRSAALAYQQVPVMVFNPETHYAVLQDSNARRAGMYWAMFHVEPLFLETWRRYQRLLRQRNAALRLRNMNYRLFDPGLVQTGLVLAGFWERTLVAMRAPFIALTERLGLGMAADTRLRPGWDGESLAEALEGSRAGDERVGYTQVGPHRADIVFEIDQRSIQEVASHGQQKVVISAWRLAVVQLVAEKGRQALVLLDDLAAELDQRRRAAFYETLMGLDLQVVVTAMEPEPLPSPAPMFHVEHGRLHGP